MLIRDHLVIKFGLSFAGYWQASWKISEIYLMLVTTTLSAYYLPRLAEISTGPELKAEIIKVYRFVMPLVTAGAIIIFIFRDFIIANLFTSDFLPIRELFPWQLVGDVIKIGSWIIAYVMLGRAMVKLFVITEIFFSIFFVILSWHFIDSFGLVGVPIAYAINYLIYWIAMIFFMKNEFSRIDY
jgi:PST family polysaccharide transporter